MPPWQNHLLLESHAQAAVEKRLAYIQSDNEIVAEKTLIPPEKTILQLYTQKVVSPA